MSFYVEHIDTLLHETTFFLPKTSFDIDAYRVFRHETTFSIDYEVAEGCELQAHIRLFAAASCKFGHIYTAASCKISTSHTAASCNTR